MKLDLKSIGVPLVYRTMSPFLMTDTELLDSFPKLANPNCLELWMTTTRTRAVGMAQLYTIAWSKFLHSFVVACEKAGFVPFILDPSRRNADAEVIYFLTIKRLIIRDYIDKLNILPVLPAFRTSRVYTRKENSWWLRSQTRIIKRLDGISIGQDLKRKNWIRTHCPEYKASQSWHRWLRPGVLRVGWSTSGTESWLWYEIRCPHMPGITGHYRNLDTAAFEKHLDSLWLPIVRSIRWWSTNNVRLWYL